ncbi:MAG: cell envelope integrity protein TolA [Piscinibacter sp.]|uniref:cell envelope integrity protein TolA n=1 Tax=Piscinibacter sp. TaxID=1903157 RepID=UPI001B557578|nr:cell envelope integrity protein TolA [Piscinibacter sp.]MBP5989018.1 cell envelope integrity protein TolA [Piscinibacter sp.]MBP6026262.1 cell envelope integrity protein TolA [Piscinibacter sp.]
MNAATLTRDALIPRNPDSVGRGLAMALAVHALLLIAIAFGVSWRSSNPAGVEAELWAAVPQIAAPRPIEPEPTPQPVKKIEPPPPPPKVETPKQDDAQIAIERAKREEQKRKEEQRREDELKRQKEEQQRKLAEAEKLKKEQAEQKKREAAAEAAAQAQRQKQLERMAALAGDGAPTSTGTAAKSAGPSASYAGRIKARILPNIVFPDSVSGNPQATVEVKAGPDGTIIGRRLLKSSGVPAWDEAVLRAIDKTEVLPRDTDGRVPPSFEISFRPRD